MSEQLTKQQQQLAESNHKLIYKFANQKNLAIDEYYDIPFYINSSQITNYDLFQKRNTIHEDNQFPILPEEIKKYYKDEAKEDTVSNFSPSSYL